MPCPNVHDTSFLLVAGKFCVRGVNNNENWPEVCTVALKLYKQYHPNSLDLNLNHGNIFVFFQ